MFVVPAFEIHGGVAGLFALVGVVVWYGAEPEALALFELRKGR